MKRILGSVGMLAFVGAIVLGATGAFFTDTETSTGNTFTAGAIDLKIDNQSYVTSTTTGQLVFSPSTSWQLADLTNQLFFNFDDLKPGDQGEDTISLHVNNNDAYICMDVTITSTPENGQTEPEAKVDQTTGENEGELQNKLKFVWWADDGDNVYEANEVIFKQGTAADLFAVNQEKWALADSVTNVWGTPGPVPGDSVKYIAKYWCFGDLTPAALPQDSSEGPLVRGTGFQCSGATMGNETQTDGMTVDVTFESIQSRNNNQFRCNSVVCTPVVTGLFSDGFESGNFSAWTTAAGNWQVVTGNQSSPAHGGSNYSIGLGDTEGGPIDQIIKAVDTSSYQNLVLSYWYRVRDGQSLEANDRVDVEWSLDGTNWTLLTSYTNINSTGGWQQATHNLPAQAQDPNFRFRFRAVLSSGQDVFKLDDVSLTGSTICPAPTI